MLATIKFTPVRLALISVIALFIVVIIPYQTSSQSSSSSFNYYQSEVSFSIPTNLFQSFDYGSGDIVGLNSNSKKPNLMLLPTVVTASSVATNQYNQPILVIDKPKAEINSVKMAVNSNRNLMDAADYYFDISITGGPYVYDETWSIINGSTNEVETRLHR